MTALAALVSLLHFDVKKASYSEYNAAECTIDATVIRASYDTINFDGYEIAVNSINGEDNKHYAILNCNYDSVLMPGYRFTAKVTGNTEFENSDGIFNEKITSDADGIFITYTSTDENSVVISEEDVFDVRISFARLNTKISNIFTYGIDGEAGELSSALLLGNRHLLSNELVRDFSRAGVAHILALSGMHMSIIMGALMFLLKHLRIKHSYIAVIMSVISVFYLILTGMSVSATRSVIMLLIVYISILLCAEPDPLTSLGIAGTVIVLISPGTIVDAAFWMSFSATLGILVYLPAFKDYIERALLSFPRFKLFWKILSKVLIAIAVGFFAMVPLLIVFCVTTKELALFSIISSAIMSPIAAAVILLSLLFLPLHTVPFFSALISDIIEFLYRLMADYCASISDMHGAVMSLNYSFAVLFALLLLGCVLWSMITETSNPLRALTPFAVVAIVFFSVIGIYEYSLRNSVNVKYLNCSSTADMLVISSERDAIICDVGNGSNTSYNKALDELYKARVTEIRAVMLTRYANAYNSSLFELFGSEKVREIWLPMPETEDEYYKMRTVVDKARLFDVDTYIYEDGDTFSLFTYVDIEAHRDYLERSSVPMSLITVSTRSERTTYLSPAYNESEELSAAADNFLQRSQFIIFGNRGPKTKTVYSIPTSRKNEIAVFADKTVAAYFDHESNSFLPCYLAPEEFEINMEK